MRGVAYNQTDWVCGLQTGRPGVWPAVTDQGRRSVKQRVQMQRRARAMRTRKKRMTKQERKARLK